MDLFWLPPPIVKDFLSVPHEIGFQILKYNRSFYPVVRPRGSRRVELIVKKTHPFLIFETLKLGDNRL